ncbi:MAG: hypothetical protein K8L97_25155 [Anaerolineae bacterium]|nr:hypothetical protein [Anaerolineae bacterium]
MKLYGCNFHQPCLPTFEKLIYGRPFRRTLGWMGEKTVQNALECAGYRVQLGRPHEGDLHVIHPNTGQLWRVEVKTALRSVDRKWRFSLWKHGHTDYRDSDVVVLLPTHSNFEAVPFVIPTNELGQRSQLVITSDPETYRGMLACYRKEQICLY